MMTETAQEAARRLSERAIALGYEPKGLHCYTNEGGAPLYYRVRLKHPHPESLPPGERDKWIRPMHANGNGFELGEPEFPDGKKPLYNLHGLAGDPDAAVWIVEGEQKADALNQLGLLATTSGGASSAAKVDWMPLRDRRVIIWPDNDAPGKGYAGQVAQVLTELGCQVCCIDVEKLGLSRGQDVIDWLASHENATAADIESLSVVPAKSYARATAEDVRLTSRLVAMDLEAFLAEPIPPRASILAPIILEQSLTMIHSWRGIGKTHVALGIAYAVASGGKFLCWSAERPRKVLLLDGEMPGAALQERLAAIVKASDLEPPDGYFRLVTPDKQPWAMPDLATLEGQALVDGAIEPDTALIIVDNLSCLVRRGGRENEAESWLTVAEWALKHRAQGRSILFIHHSGKNKQQRGTSKREDLLDAVLALKQPADYDPKQGAVFEVHFEKARGLFGDDTVPFEATLGEAKGKQVWTMRPIEETTFDRVIELFELDLSQNEIAAELGINKSNVSRALKKAESDGQIVRKGKPK